MLYRIRVCKNSIHRFIIPFLIAVVSFGVPTPVLGQTDRATLFGTVTDAGGAVIPQASIVLENTATGTTRMGATNTSGQFTLPALDPGVYALHVEKQGFAIYEVKDITLNVAGNRQLEIKLSVGPTQQSVTVDASGATINTTDASVSTVIDRQFAEDLPLNGRTFQSLINLTPGVTINMGSGLNPGFGPGGFTVNGQRASSNYWTVDGVGANIGMTPWQTPGQGSAGGLGGFNAQGGTNSLVPVDALQEFRIETSTYPPEFGREPGGQISIVTRSGTNAFHGSLFDYFRNTDLDATDWFTEHEGLPKAGEHQNDFGGVLGGPVVKDKTFFFFSYEGLRLRLPQTALTTVPDLATRQSALPAVQPWLNAYPLPNPGATDIPCSATVPCSSGSSGIAPFNSSFSNPSFVNVYSLRLDHALAKNLNIFARYSQSPAGWSSRAFFGNPANAIFSLNSITKTATVGATWAKSSRVVNEARLNFSASGGGSYATMDTLGGAIVPPSSDLFASPYTYNNSNFYLDVVEGTNMGYEQGLNARNYLHQYNIVDTVTVQSGPHSLKFGADYRRLSTFMGDVLYGLSTYFSSVQDLATGYSYFTQTTTGTDPTFLFHNLGVFAQDTWKVTPRLTVTYGLRWDVDFTPTTTSGPSLPAVTGFSLTDLSNLALAPAGTPIYGTKYGNVAPRIGGAYQLSQRPGFETVLRGGFGIYYDLSSTEIGNLDNFAYPFLVSSPGAPAPFPTPAANAMPAPHVPPDATQGVLFGFDPNLNLPYALEWSAAVEQGLRKDQTLKISYIGSSGRRLLATESISNPNSNYRSADLVANAGSSNYNALQVQFQRRLSMGLQVLASYAWSHSIDTGSYGEYADGSFANIKINRGVSDFDIRNVLSVGLTYDIPTVRRNAFTKAILGGWSTHNNFQARSAPPDDLVDGAFSAVVHQNAAILVRPDVVRGQPLYLHGSQYPGGKALNPDAFMHPPLTPAGCNPTTDANCEPARQGDLGRNALSAFGLTQWDFAVHRDFPIREEMKLQFRFEMFNILNHPNFAPYNSTFGTGDPYFGQSTQMYNQAAGVAVGAGGLSAQYQLGGPRSIQLALKLFF